jgi:sulfur carrier protein ThiS
MLKRITIGVLLITLILAVGCGNDAESVKNEDREAQGPSVTEDGIAQDRVFVEFTVPYRDIQVSDLLESLGSHVMETVYYGSRVQVTVPEGKTAADMVDILNGNPLVECVEPYYFFDPDQVVVKFNVAYDDETVSDLLASLGTHISRIYEYSDFVLVSVPEDRTVAEIVDALSSSPLVEYAEPDYYLYY